MNCHIAYVSLARSELEPKVLSDILEVSVRNNRRDGITGVLMHHDDLFFQVLEGERRVVEQCYARICKDPRHTSISETLNETVEVRSFPDWLMGYVGPDEIGKYSDGALLSLAELDSPKFSSADRRGNALLLARLVFKGFTER
ncbi:BLUF domain-containing protein [Loktanella sp. DJP18]|uniref:BLUF domain-containing protein n=1 Tax=Loktanella sp. DJP18 TaxID=3409788 RepID=UPI003BB620E2